MVQKILSLFGKYGRSLTAQAGKKFAGRFVNNGRTYNTGNAIAFGGAVLQVIANSHGTAALLHAVAGAGGDAMEIGRALATYAADIGLGLTTQFAGNLPSLATTAAAVAFFIGGRDYHQAWADPDHFNAEKDKRGHILSGTGAASLAAGLYGLAHSDFARAAAVVGGVLHTAGKFGSAWHPRYAALYKKLPLASRVPAIASAVWDIHDTLSQYPGMEAAPHAILPTAIILCLIVCARGDVMSMEDGPVRRLLGRPLFVPPAPTPVK